MQVQKFVAVALLFLGCSSSLLAGERYAFLIGVSKYPETQLRSLPYTEDDVTALAERLNAAGFPERNMVVLTQSRAASDLRWAPLAKNIRNEFDLLTATLEKDDTLIVAFSGHGVQFKGEKENYFCAAETNLEDRSTLVSLTAIYQELESCPARVKLLLVDACRNDPLSELGMGRAKVVLESVTRPQEQEPPGGVAALFSCAAGQQAYFHPDLKHGVFFYYTLEALAGAGDLDGDRAVSLAELEQYVGKNVKSYVRNNLRTLQTPQRLGEIDGGVELVKLEGAGGLPLGEIGRLMQAEGEVRSLVFTEQDSKLLAFSVRRQEDGQYERPLLCVWDVASRKRLRKTILAVETGNVFGTLSSDGGELAVMDGEALRVFDAASGGDVAKFSSRRYKIIEDAASFNGLELLCRDASKTKDMLVVDLTTGGERRFAGHTAPLYCAAFSSDRRRIISGGVDGLARIWSVETGEALGQLERELHPIKETHFTPDGRFAVTASWYAEDGLSLWEIASGKEIRRFDRPLPLDYNIARFTPDGRRLVAASSQMATDSDFTIRVWDVATGEKLGLWRTEADIDALAIAGNGRLAAFALADGTIRLWQLPVK